jgi:hypothetical protein
MHFVATHVLHSDKGVAKRSNVFLYCNTVTVIVSMKFPLAGEKHERGR